MPKLYLTDAAVRRLTTPATGQVDYWDTQLKGFGLRVSCGGARTFILNSNRTRLTIGRYGPAGMSLAEARQQALQAKFIANQPTRISFAAARDRFVEKHLAQLKASTCSEQTRAIRRFNFTKPLASITNDDVLRALDGYTRGTARTYYNVMRSFLNWCVQNDYLVRSPLKKSPYKARHRDRLLTDDEIKLIWLESYNHDLFGVIVRTLILTGQRLNQISSLQPTWLRSATIVFPGLIMKSNKEHTIPLSAWAKVTLDTLTPVNSFFFPNPIGDKPFSSHGKGMAEFRAALSARGFEGEHFVLHDFRRYLSSTMAMIGTPIDITEAILDHRSGSRSDIQRIYDRYSRLEPMRSALERYENHLETLGLSPVNILAQNS